MKKVLLFASVISIIACSDNKKETERSVKDLRTYVDSVGTHDMDYQDDAYWVNVERGYEEKRQHIDTKIAQSDENLKKDYDQLEKDYADLKTRYTTERERVRQGANRKLVLRTSLFGEGVIGEDMNFGFMTGQNALQTYEHFVNTVTEHRDEYSREDWDEIKVLYEAMDTRKNEIEKDLPAKDNLKIAGLKVKFATIKAVNRPMSKVEENSGAKENRE